MTRPATETRCDICVVYGADEYDVDGLDHTLMLCPVCRDQERRDGRKVTLHRATDAHPATRDRLCTCKVPVPQNGTSWTPLRCLKCGKAMRGAGR